mgnify:CR=1 FL=1
MPNKDRVLIREFLPLRRRPRVLRQRPVRRRHHHVQLGEQEEQPEADDEDETGFSMGLLRRRRMGTAAKDITEG